MRFDSGSLLLGLIALGAWPEATARVLQGEEVHVDGLYNVTDSLLARAIPVRPHPDAPPTPPTAPITKPGDKTPDEPVRLVPGDKKPDGDNTPVGKPVSDKDPDFPLLCMRGNGECRRSRHDDDYYRREYETRGSAVLGKHTRRERSDFPDYGPRLESRYAHKDHYYQDSVEDSFDSLPSLGKYGFEPSDFEAQSVYSKKHRQDRDGNLLYNDKGEARYTRDSDPILEFSHSRKRHEDVDREVFVAHHRYKNRDRNVYDLDYDGNPRNVDEWGDPIPRSTWKDDSVPAFQMMHEKSKRSKYYRDEDPDEYYLVSENVANRQTVKRMEEGLEWANSRPERKGKSPLRRYSFSRDDEPFNKLVGSDNGYSYAKMMQENKRYEDYEADYLDVSMDPAPAMGMGYRRRRH